jgi:hypothetical protein
MPIGVDDTRRGIVLLTQGFGQEALCCGRVLLGREKEVEGGAGGIHRPVKVTPSQEHDILTLTLWFQCSTLFERKAGESFCAFCA